VVELLLPKLPKVRDALIRILGTNLPARRLYDIPAEFGIPMALREIGMPKDGITQAIREVFQSNYWMPATVNERELDRLLTNAWNGSRPGDV
jgi:alcohol dehydrogenase class IV